MSNASDIGRAGEFLASYILETFGVEVHHVNRDGADLWCKINNSRIVTVDVKTASKPISPKKTRNVYQFHTPGRIIIDYHAFVALDRQLMLMQVFDPDGPTTTSLPTSSFNETNQRRTIEEMIAAC
jgi:hypothetical protein